MATNEFGLDTDYFEKKISGILRDINQYKPEELSRELSRLADACGTTASARFLEFWAIYPNRVKKKAAMRTWRSRKLDKLADVIISSVRIRVSNDPRWQEGYIPDPTTFLNGDRWEDEITTIPVAVTWPTKDSDWEALGRKHNVSPGMGETWPMFKERVKRAISTK